MGQGQDTDIWRFELYLIGDSRLSQFAMENFREICDDHLQGHYHVDVYDVRKHPELMMSNRISVVPTLIKKHPLPEKMLIGDLSSTRKVLEGLGLDRIEKRQGTGRSYIDGLKRQGLSTKR
jgi:circadian clock protein KaiB